MPIAISSVEKVKIAIDRGGTFTDCVAITSTGSFLVKLLSVDPSHYDDAPTEGIRRILETFTGEKIPRDALIDTSRIEWIRMGTTVATNALLERRGEPHALLITKGFKDLIEIGTQTRPFLFELAIKKPDVLYSKVVEVDERVVLEYREVDAASGLSPEGERLVKGLSGDLIRVVNPIDATKAAEDLKALYAEGIRSVAIVLAHSYTFQEHELVLEKIAKEIGFTNVSVSSQLQSMIKIVSRGTSATADAYLTPSIKKYITSFSKGFKGHFKQGTTDCQVSFMQSDGSLVDFRSFSGLKAILSGPAGGVVGFARTCYNQSEGSPVIGFDMGGTSTDVSRFGGLMEHVFETTTAGVTIQSPQLDINTVAAGGGSMLFWRNGLFVVGPQSASAHPGPACYRKGGPLTVTDANLFLGRLSPDSFPHIFGPEENLPLDVEVTARKFKELADVINAEIEGSLTPEEIACGFINVANESMARPIRAMTEARGYSTSAHNLSCFGGAGGQHASAIASLLGIHTILVHKYSSVLSAFGMALADIGVDLTEPSVEVMSPESLLRLQARTDLLKIKAEADLIAQGIPKHCIQYECYLNMRYDGTDTSLMVLAPQEGTSYEAAFEAQHHREFSFIYPGKTMIVDDIRVRAVGSGESVGTIGVKSWHEELISLKTVPVDPALSTITKTYFEETGSHLSTPIYKLIDLTPGTVVSGPAIILDETQTLVIHPANTATILRDYVYIDVGLGPRKKLNATVVDPIQLSIFGHRFMSIAEEMGRVLQKTSVSLQIKERLDFSCAVFSSDGSLVANAPHIPVHLGSMQYAVMYQAELHKGALRPGDVLVSNHPKAGGTHLPDITVIVPVFDENEIVFFVAARGHHTDIGGLKGNSMSPDTTELWQEGAVIKSTFLIRDGIFNIDEVTELLTAPGRYPNCEPAIKIQDNISDLKAQCAACTVGSSKIRALFNEYGKDVVQFYMTAIRANAELAVRNFLKSTAAATKSLHAIDYMDDGSAIELTVSIDETTGSAVFDFEGTGAATMSNLNAPDAVCKSALIYSLRTLIGTDMPLNSGVLRPIELKIPEGSLLCPGDGVAINSGNTETSQRVCDVIFKAFEACAASQGCMNVLQFIRPGASYGETICGGSGAGPTWKGASAVHVNMTNTKITDPEILEKRQPVILREFSIREGTGGIGMNEGGCGVHREFEFLEPMQVAVIGERRVNQPYGMHGGGPGARGSSFVVRKKGDTYAPAVKTKPSCSLNVEIGDRFIMHTPGGGGYGTPGSKLPASESEEAQPFVPRANGTVNAWTAMQETN